MLMRGLLNGINPKVEVGDNFMNVYKKYITYANKSISELQQLIDIKKTLKGKKLAEKIRELGLKWITKSAVDSILHGLGESNDFPHLTPAEKQIANKLVSLRDSALTYKSSAIQGILDENAEMAQSDVTKIIDYSEKLQSMFNTQDNLEDWVKAKLNHACDYVATVRDYLKFYRDERETVDEIDSSMAMGALKQLNNDAKELQSMLKSDTHLEDWVKAKLNLAGEYLDDVYHHLNHFGPEGRTLDEVYANSGLGKWFGKGGVGSSSGGGWDRYDSTGKKAGKCGDAKKGSSYSACLGKKYVDRLRSKGGRKAIANWVRRKKAAQNKAGRGEKGSGSKGKAPVKVSYKEQLCEIFIINHKEQLKKDLVQFLTQQFQKDHLKAVHGGPSITEFKPEDWVEKIAENLINRLLQYFEIIRGQTERNLKSSIPLTRD